jgi:hypothetical protein
MLGNLFGPRYRFEVGDGVMLSARNISFRCSGEAT